MLKAVLIFRWINPDTAPTTLAAEYDFSSLSWYQRSSAKEITLFASREVAKRSLPGQLRTIAHQQFHCHVRVGTLDHTYTVGDFHTRTEKIHLAAVAFTESTYPTRVAFSLISKVMEQFLELHSLDSLSQYSGKDVLLNVPPLRKMVAEYQHPDEADKISRVQKQLDETKDILLESLDALLQRGEKLDDLTSRSEDLSFKSRAFMKEAEKLNSCCTLF